MTREYAIKVIRKMLAYTDLSDRANLTADMVDACRLAIKALEQEPCEDTISRKSIKQKLQEHHDFFVNAYGGFSNLPQNDKSRVDEITNCIAMVVNEPSVTPQKPKIKVLERDEAARKLGAVDIYQASAWITLLNDLEYLKLKICEVEE